LALDLAVHVRFTFMTNQHTHYYDTQRFASKLSKSGARSWNYHLVCL